MDHELSRAQIKKVIQKYSRTTSSHAVSELIHILEDILRCLSASIRKGYESSGRKVSLNEDSITRLSYSSSKRCHIPKSIFSNIEYSEHGPDISTRSIMKVFNGSLNSGSRKFKCEEDFQSSLTTLIVDYAHLISRLAAEISDEKGTVLDDRSIVDAFISTLKEKPLSLGQGRKFPHGALTKPAKR